MKRHLLSLIALSLVVCVASAPALAKKPEHAGGHGKSHESEEFMPSAKDHRAEHEGHQAIIVLDDERRASVHAYMTEHYKRGCPPGLAKKNRRCMPPGQAKKYQIGGVLPMGHRPPPALLLERLGPPPAGTFYTMVDNDVVLAVEGTKKILDAITLFSAME